jgi:ATP-dependent Lhr-like helicase
MPGRARGGRRERAQDTPPARTGALDVLAQHVLGCACGEPFVPMSSTTRSQAPRPIAGLARADFDAVVDFVATGGYALKVYERFAKIRLGKDGRWRVSNPRVAQQYRLNVGTIVEETMLKVRLVRSSRGGQGPRGDRARRPRARRGRGIFHRGLVPGDTFVFAGEVLRFEAMVEDEAYVSRATAEDPKVPAYMGGKFPLSTYLAARVRGIISARRVARCRRRCANGSKSSNGARCCRAAANFWSRPFRAPTSITWSAIRSKAGSPIRRSACC